MSPSHYSNYWAKGGFETESQHNSDELNYKFK
jgi:hypothetical protein